jgi:predicted transposase/invertase (TIGR01784 family)
MLVATMQYMLQYADIGDVDHFLRIVIESMPEREASIMSAAQQLEQRGIKKGMQRGMHQGMHQGMQKMARYLLSENKHTVSEIADITGLDEEEIKKLKDEE